MRVLEKKICKLEKKIIFQNATNFLDLAFKNQKKVLETQNKFFLQNLKKNPFFFTPKNLIFFNKSKSYEGISL